MVQAARILCPCRAKPYNQRSLTLAGIRRAPILLVAHNVVPREPQRHHNIFCNNTMESDNIEGIVEKLGVPI